MRSCQDHDRVFIDATNAFNLVERMKAFEAIYAPNVLSSHQFSTVYMTEQRTYGFAQRMMIGPHF